MTTLLYCRRTVKPAEDFMSDLSMNSSHLFDLVIGLDRSDRSADLTLIHTHSGKKEKLVISTAPEALHDWLARLRQQLPQARIALCLEQPAANLILFLEAYDWITLYAINPITLQKFREAFVTSRAKDDGKDADYLAELLLSHHAKLKAWQPDNAQTRLLQQLVSHRRAVVNERTGLCNRLKALLKQCFPQALELCGEELWRPMATAFLLKWPTLQALQKAKPATIKQFYHLHGSRSQKLIDERLQLVQKAVPLTDEPSVLESHTLRIQLLCRQLQLLATAIDRFDQRIATVFKTHEDRAIFESFPGAGDVLAPRLLASIGSERDRFAKSSNLQCLSGIAPVTKQSGGKCHIHRRYLCPQFSKQSFHEYAAQSVLWSRWAAAYYLQQRRKGCSHQTAVRALAYKWQRIIWKCWQTRTPYNEEIYEATLRRRKSPIVALFDEVEVGKSPWRNPAKKN